MHNFRKFRPADSTRSAYTLRNIRFAARVDIRRIRIFTHPMWKTLWKVLKTRFPLEIRFPQLFTTVFFM